MTARGGWAGLAGLLLFSLACGTSTVTLAVTLTPLPAPKSRLDSIPAGHPKGSPETDFWPRE
jgi:hypothetical protein